jgi:hypothetical protein
MLTERLLGFQDCTDNWSMVVCTPSSHHYPVLNTHMKYPSVCYYFCHPCSPLCVAEQFRNQYDGDVVTWSPQGRIHQIEYAMEAVKQVCQPCHRATVLCASTFGDNDIGHITDVVAVKLRVRHALVSRALPMQSLLHSRYVSVALHLFHKASTCSTFSLSLSIFNRHFECPLSFSILYQPL